MYINTVSLYNHDCLPILAVLYIMLAYLMFADLSNAVFCTMLFLLLIYGNAFCFMLFLGLLTYSLFISSKIFHHAHFCWSFGFS